jgi:hypothetical protein
MGKLIDEYFDYVLEGKCETIAKEIVFVLIEDFTDRRGLRQEWENIDDDIKEEMIQTWIDIVKAKLDKRI